MTVARATFEAAIFDMDGLLTDSEPRWRQAEEEKSAELGLGLTTADFERTMGVRMAEVAALWFEWRPWTGPTPEAVAESVVDRVVELTVEGAEPLPGVVAALEACRAQGMRLGLCSSSDSRLINATLAALDLGETFDAIHSAEHDEYGKPHPMPYLRTAAALNAQPARCVAFEDSLNGAVAARAANMSVVAVPDLATSDASRFEFCHAVLPSLESVDAALWSKLSPPQPQ